MLFTSCKMSGIMKESMTVTRESCLADLYQLLSVLIKCPDKTILAGLLDGTIEEDCHGILADLGWSEVTARIVDHWDQINQMTEEYSEEDFFSLLRREYTRLFITPKAEEISLYEGIFLLPPGKIPDMGPLIMRSPAAMDARMCYRQAGLAMAEQGSADHMELELEFMSYLWGKLDASDAKTIWQTHKEEFETRHMRKWMGAFFLACQEKTIHPYYRMVGILGQELAARELQK